MTLLIQSAKAVVRVAANNNEGYLNQWVSQLKEQRGFNKTIVAVTNKNTRIIRPTLLNEKERVSRGGRSLGRMIFILRNGY